jgi:hypothetical protein
MGKWGLIIKESARQVREAVNGEAAYREKTS